MDVIDLSEFATTLPEGHEALRRSIKDTIDVHSAHSDLKIAHDSAARFISLNKSEAFPREFVEDCGLALLVTGILFYVRATKSSSDHRKTFDLRARFDDLERQDHDLLVRLRDDALAHYGPGQLGTETIREDSLFFSISVQKLFSTSRNICGSDSLGHTIRRQSQRALILMQRLYEQKQIILLGQLKDLPASEAIDAAFQSAIFQLSTLVGPEMANQIESGPFVGAKRLSGGTKKPRKSE
ncbi:MAG: hypothetical protein ABIO29_00940 [Sphingomicrobium sp.]